MTTRAFDKLIAHYNLLGASDGHDKHMFSTSDIIDHPQDGVLYIKHNNPKSKHLMLRIDNDEDNDRREKLLKRLCYILRQNDTVENLSISGRHINTRASPFWLFVGIQNNRSIRELSITDLQLDGHMKLNILGDFLINNPRLQKLILNRCRLGLDDIDCLADKLLERSSSRSTGKTLELLDLSGNVIGNNALERLVYALIKMKSVKRLNLGSNELGARSVASIAGLLQNQACTIEEIDVSKNSIGAESATHLINSLRGNNRLKRLDMNDNPIREQDWSTILHRVLDLVYDNSSIYNVLNSNHTLSSLGTHRGNPGQTRRRQRFRRYPMEEIYNRCLGEEFAQYLHSSFVLNYRAESDAFKARHKILWSHANGAFNLGEEPSIDLCVMPRIIAFLGDDSDCESCHRAKANLIQYRDETPPRQVLDTIRLDAIYRILQVRPELCSQHNELHRCQRELADTRNKNKKLQLELERLRSQLSYDSFMPMIRKIRALLGMNAEIFGRCMGSIEELCNDMKENCEASLSRYSFDIIQAYGGSSIQFSTEASHSSRTFDLKPLSKIPPGLEGYLVVQYKSSPFSKFISYDAILKTALLFRSEVLESILPKLKDHLEIVHLCLRAIDDWLAEPNLNQIFIETTFGVKLSTPNKDDATASKCSCSQGTHQKSSICLQCQCPLQLHKERRCPKGNTYFTCKKSHVLKSFHGCDSSLLSESGHDVKRTLFEIEKTTDQLRLQRLLDTISRYNPRAVCNETRVYDVDPVKLPSETVDKDKHHSNDTATLATGMETATSTQYSKEKELVVRQPQRKGRVWGNISKRK